VSKTIAIYTRINIEAAIKSFGGSFSDQVQKCVTRARELFGDKASIRLYHDESLDAYDQSRLTLQNMIDDIRNGMISAVVVSDITRLSRRAEDIESIQKLCKTQGIELIRVDS